MSNDKEAKGGWLKYVIVHSSRDDAGSIHYPGSVIRLSGKRGTQLVKLGYARLANPAAEEVEVPAPKGK